MDTTTLKYAVVIMLGLLVFTLLYAILIPKRKDSFSPQNEDKTKDKPALKMLMLLGSEAYSAMPGGSFNTGLSPRDEQLQELLKRSGNPWGLKPQEFRFLQPITAVIGAVIGAFLWFFAFSFDVNIPWFVLIPLGGLVGFFVPRITYREAAADRDLQFKRELPKALDLINISVSSGDDVSLAIRKATPLLRDSVLKQELEQVVRSVDSGKTMHDALEDFAGRVPSTGIEAFVRSLQEALAVNVSVTSILRSRSDESRAELNALIRERTEVLPTKMASVLAVTTSLSLLIILLAPSLEGLAKGLS